MSDYGSEYEYEYDEDELSQDSIVYTDEEKSNDNPDIEKENAYYNAKSMIEQSVVDATEAFEKVIRMEMNMDISNLQSEAGKWTFKALKQLVKLHLRMGKSEDVVLYYKRLLDCIASGAVTSNQCEKGINSILDKVSSPIQTVGNDKANKQKLARQLFNATLQLFHPQNNISSSSTNERLWFKTNLKLGQLLYELKETKELQSVIKDLLRHQHPESATNLMEIYALQIQLYSRLKNNKKLREIFEKAMKVTGGIPHPRTVALIQELGGKMHMASREFNAASTAFFQAFKEYGKAGDNTPSLRCLKFLVMASMLHSSTINPFDSQEARPYRDDPEIKVMTSLVQAFQNNQIEEFEEILRRNEEKLMADDFIREHVEELKRTIRTQVLQSVIVPYTRISLQYISKSLNGIPVEDVSSLLVSLILDGKLHGKIDEIEGILEKKVDFVGRAGSNGKKNLEKKEIASLENLVTQMELLGQTVTNSPGRFSYH